MRTLARAIIRGLLWPVRRFFDPRFQGLAQQLAATHEHLARHAEEARAEAGARYDAVQSHAEGRHREALTRHAETVALLDELRWLVRSDMDAANEATTVVNRTLRDLLAGDEAIRQSLDEFANKLAAPLTDIKRSVEILAGEHLERLASGSIDDIDDAVARVLNHAATDAGFAAQRNLWFDPGVVVRYRPRDVYVAEVRERVAEAAYSFRALATVEPGSSVLVAGAAETTVSLSLASLGYAVTAVDPRPVPIEHPNLRSVAAPIDEWRADTAFDAVVCLSTVAYIGLGRRGEPVKDGRPDLAAMERLGEAARPSAVLVLTVPYGRGGTDAFPRQYDRKALDELLRGWRVEDLSFARRTNPTTWIFADGDAESSDAGTAVAFVTARRGT